MSSYELCPVCNGLAVDGVCQDCGVGEGWQEEHNEDGCDNCDNCGACTYVSPPLPELTTDMFYVEISAMRNPDGSLMHPELEGRYVTAGRTRASRGETKADRLKRERAARRKEKAALLKTYIERGYAFPDCEGEDMDVDGVMLGMVHHLRKQAKNANSHNRRRVAVQR